jgi:hypothetical protein
MIFNRERDICFGRTFSQIVTDKGLLANFYNWITRSPVASPVSKSTGGPGWYMIDDHSTDASDPYIIVSDNTWATISADPNAVTSGPYKILKVGFLSAETGKIRITGYMYWDAGTSTGYGKWCEFVINTADGESMQYDFRGGPDVLAFSARKQADWSVFTIADWTGDVKLVEGPAIVTDILNSVTAGTDVVLQLGVGEGANYTKGNYYFIYDFNGVEKIDYAKVTKNGVPDGLGVDQIAVDRLRQNFGIGSVICAYRHRLTAWCTNKAGLTSYDRYCCLPYYSVNSEDQSNQNYRFYNSQLTGRVSARENLIRIMTPDDAGYFLADVAVIGEYLGYLNNTTDANRGYGTIVGIYITSSSGMLQMTDGKTINTDNYLYTDEGAKLIMGPDLAVLLPDWDSVS